MTECFNPEMKELIPDLAAERLDEALRVRVMQHLELCEACAEEHEILRVVRAAQMPVPYINVPKIVRALPPAPIPVRTELPWFRRASFQMAAALVLVAGGLISVRQAGDRVDSRASSELAVAGSSAVQPQSASAGGVDKSPPAAAPAMELAQVAEPARTDIALVAGLDEMTTDELTSLLKEVGNISAVPVAEPEQFSPVTALTDNPGEG